MPQTCMHEIALLRSMATRIHGCTAGRQECEDAQRPRVFFLVRLVSAMGAPVLDLWSYGPTIAVSRYPITYWNSIFSGDRLKKHDPDHRSVPHVDMINASRQPVKQGGGMPVVTVMTSGGQQRDDIARGTTERGERGTWKSTSRGGWGDGIDGG
jgi:hypothetical protein